MLAAFDRRVFFAVLVGLLPWLGIHSHRWGECDFLKVVQTTLPDLIGGALLGIVLAIFLRPKVVVNDVTCRTQVSLR
jgi:hypothetical protein